jgi:hypothetical protein
MAVPKEDITKKHLPGEPGHQKRLCHDCKKPTTDYRCKVCREKWIKKNNLNLSDFN